MPWRADTLTARSLRAREYMHDTEHIPAQDLDTHNIFHDTETENPGPHDLLVVLDAVELDTGPVVYAVGDPETGDYEGLFVAEETETVQLYSHRGL